MADAFLWWLTIQALGLIALPIATLLMRALPDWGYTAAKPLGLLLVGWLAYTASMLKLMPFGRGLLVISATLVLALSSLLLLRNGAALWEEMRTRFRNPAFLRHVLAAELLFGLLFAVWAILRAYNPDIVDQEKFMDFGILNSILKSGTLPPHDMWLAGQPLNYYYFGYILMAAMTSLSGVATQISFNLANAFLFAMTGLVGYGVVYNLIQGTILRRNARPAPAPRPTASVASSTGGTGGTGDGRPKRARATVNRGVPVRPASNAQFALAGANGGTYAAAVDEEVVSAPTTMPTRRGGAARRTGDGTEAATHDEEQAEGAEDPTRRVPFYLSPILYGVLGALMLIAMGNLAAPFGKKDSNNLNGNGWTFCFFCEKQGYDYWWAPSRVILDYKTTTGADGLLQKTPVGFETINEFPAFSFVLGDMHPHVMALPFVLLAVLSALALARRKVAKSSLWRDGIPRSVAGWASLLLTALIAGSLYTTNTWDYPTYLLVILLGTALPYITAGRREGGWRWIRPFIVQTVLLVVLSLLFFTPFHLTFKSFAGGQPTPLPDNVANIPVLGTLLQKLSGIFLLNTADKTITGFLVIFGVFLFALVGWLGYEFVSYMRKRLAPVEGSRNNTLYVFAAFFVLTLLVAFLLKFPLLALLLPIIAVAGYLIWQEPRRTERNMALGLFMVAATIGLAVEIFYLHDNFGNRMNTLFKFYYQMWVLMSLAAAYGFWRTLLAAFGREQVAPVTTRSTAHTGRGVSRMPLAPISTNMGAKALAGVWATLFLLLVASGLTYAWLGSQTRNVQGRTNAQGLDGTAFLKSAMPDDLAAIQWLNTTAGGQNVVLECCHNEYDLAGRISAFTGIPTLVAWDFSHEDLWRAGQPELLTQIGDRRRAVNAVYQGTDPNDATKPMTPVKLLDTLNKYNVDYVVVGAVERGLASPRTGPFDKGEQLLPYADTVMKATLKQVFQSGSTVIYGVKGVAADPNLVIPTPVPAGAPGTPAPTVAVPDPNAPPLGLFDHAAAGVNRGQFNLPRGIARDAAGNFYVADTENKRVQKFDAQGKWLLSFGSKGTGDGQFAAISEDSTGTGPGGVAVDGAGNVYVADTWNHRIQKFDGQGKLITKWGSFLSLADPNAPNEQNANSRFYGPRGVAVGPDGSIYVTDTGNKRVLVFDAMGKPLRQIDSGLTAQKLDAKYPFSAPGELNEPVGVTVDDALNVYVADTNNHRIEKFDKAGKFTAQWPIPASAWDPGPYLEPFLVRDGKGTIYATAPTGKSVLAFDPNTGKQLGSKNGNGQATLSVPTGLWADKDGKLYVVDTSSNSVVKIDAVP